MRKSGLIGFLLVFLFMLPATNPSMGPVDATESIPQFTPYDDRYSVSQNPDLSTGTGNPLDVIISGEISNAGEGSHQITSGSSGTSSVTLEDGWAGSNLNAEIDTLSMVAEDVLDNGNFDDTHNEKFIITATSSKNDDNVIVPDSWTLIKDVPNDDIHPAYGVYNLAGTPGGYGSTYGVRIVANDYSGTLNHVPGEEIYLSQMVSLPWREVYSVTISFRYYVEGASILSDQNYLFLRIGGVTKPFHVFESGDVVDTWLTASTTISAASMSDLSSYATLFDIGLTSDQSGIGGVQYARVRIDNVEVDFTVRPFPEQVDLKTNGTIVWGSTTYSVNPYVPDDANRDCYDTPSNGGLDLDGYGNDGGLGIGIYSTGYYPQDIFQAAFQFPLDIPKGAIITQAYFEAEAHSQISSYLPGMRISVADRSNMTPFTTGGASLENRYSWLDTSIDWSINSWVVSPTTRYRSPNLGPLVQKVISNSSWVEGNYLGLMTDLMYATYYQQGSDIKGSSSFGGTSLARLFVEYVIPEPEDTVLFFNYQKDITIDHNQVAATLINFQVFIDITDTDLKTKSLANGNDIAFTLNGVPLDHEIEMFDQDYSPTEARLVAWVKVPTLSDATDTVITMHYGNAEAPVSDPGKVWDDYATVNHLSDNPTGMVYDSTSNNHDGTPYGSMAGTDLIDGKVGKAISFDGINDMLCIGQIDTDQWTQFTMSAWVYHTLNDDNRVFSKSHTTSPTAHIITLRVASNLVTNRISTDGVGATGLSRDGNTTMTIGDWHYISWSWSAARASVICYMDGNPVIEVFCDGDTILDSDAVFVIGNTDLLNDRFWNGYIDEARLTTMVRSKDWVDTEYSNQNNPSGFYTVGDEIEIADTWSDAGDTELVFTTSSLTPITLQTYVTMDISGFGQTLDENFDPGTSYYIASGSTIVNWTAKIMVSPPAGATSMGFNVEYPRAEWKPTAVLNPFNNVKIYPDDWSYQAGTLTLNPSSIDFWGMWTLKFISANAVEDLTMGITGQTLGTTATFNIGDSMKFLATTPTINGASVGFVLTDPDGTVRYTSANSTVTSPSVLFPSFAYRKDFTIAASSLEDLDNFPVALDFTDTDLYDNSKVRADGSDIMFAQGSIILDHEIEFFDQTYGASTARLVAWVSANLSSSSTTTISMYYGSPVVDNLENPQGVWGADYDAVWHLGEDVVDEASGGIIYDSTTGGYNGIQNGDVETLTSRVGYAQDFDGNDYIAFDETLTPPGDVQISGWFRITSTHNSGSLTKVLMSKYIDQDHDMVIALAGSDYGHSTVPAGSLVFKVESSTDGATYRWTTRQTWNPGWYYIACQAIEDDPTSNPIFVAYSTAGGWDTNVSYSGGSAPANMNYVEEWDLGGGNYEAGAGETSAYFTGQMDEWRVGHTHQSLGWLQTEKRNQEAPSSFAVKGTEVARTSPDHTFTQTLGDFPAGVWTASAYYNDSGSSVSTVTGLFERTFTVMRDTTLTLTKPTTSPSVKIAGAAVIVEFKLEDTLNLQGIEDATITMNWTTPSTITLDEYGNGFYGKVLSTDDLGDAKRWRIDVDSTCQYYNDDSEYFEIDLYHETELGYSDVTTTPVNNDFTATLTFFDSYTSNPITDAAITLNDDSPIKSYTNMGSGVYNITIDSSALSLGNHYYTLKATSADSYLESSSTTIRFTLRAHFTAMSVTGGFITPVGNDTDVTVLLIDLDTGYTLDESVVTSFTFESIPGGTQVEIATSDLDATLNTASWGIGVYSINVTMIMADSDYAKPQMTTFSIQIRPHYTALSVSGELNQPYGNMTPLTLHLIDLDWNQVLGSSIVNDFDFTWQGGSYNYLGGGSLSFNLDTSAWLVGTKTVTVATTMSDSSYYNPADYQFNINIRSMISLMYLGPSILNFSLGTDFTVKLHLNTSEAGYYFGDAITGRTAGEFSVPGYTIAIDTSQNANGIYKLTISESYFTGGNYQIRVYFTSLDNKYANTFLDIPFTYREIVSYLSSPNYPQVVTPYQLDVEIVLQYADADTDTGIESADIDSPDHQAWIANVTDLTGGFYSVWIDVSSLAQGTHYINLQAYKSGYDARTLQFRIVIREAYTSAIPSVGSLDIPLGSSLSFYVDYTDVDRLVPIDNSSIPYTLAISTWSNFDVVYLSGIHKYQIIFHTTDSDTISQNVLYTFTFSKGTNYQASSFNVSVSIRTHNTDFRLVSAIEPTSTIGTFVISVYYGDLDDGVGIYSLDVDFWVENASGVVSSSYDFDLVLGDGYYTISVPASQFGLGLQTFTIYADWTAAIAKYQDKSFVTSANVVGRISTLTLIVAADPTPYNEDVSYTFFFSDTGVGIDNTTSHVFIFVSFQGETVNPGDVTIIDLSLTQPGNYSVAFNTGIFSRIGLIYMDISVEWEKGVSPYYSNRTDTISVRVLQRDTLLQVSPPSPTAYGEIAAFNFTFDDITREPDTAIPDDIKLLISMNVAFTYSETGGIFTIYVDTTQFGAIGLKTLLLSVTWGGAPFYANKTGRTVYLSVINRDTYLEYLTPAPTQYLDEVMFNVTWTDITGGATDPITGAVPSLYNGATPIDGSKWDYDEIAPGVYQFTLNTTYVTTPGIYNLRVDLSAGSTGVVGVSVTRQFNIRSRLTLLSAEPVATVAFNSSIVVVLYFQDLLTAGFIGNDSADGYPATLTILSGDGSGWIYTATWRPAFGDYILTVETYNQPYMTYTPYTLTLRMSYAYQSPFYSYDDLTIEFQLRNRVTSLALTSEAETTPYGDDAVFTVFYGDVDASGVGVAGATIAVLNNSIPLTEDTHYTLTEGNGFYTITIHSQYLGDLAAHTVRVQASWTGTPYYSTASRDVSILVRERETNVEITVAPSQTLYLDNVSFTFVYTDLDAGTDISIITSANIHLEFLNSTEIFGYSVNKVGSSFEISISSTLLSSDPVSGLSIKVKVDWDGSVAPFYSDDETIVKVTITKRILLVETSQIDRTPYDDTMVITITVTDLDTGAPVLNAIISFDCQNESLVEGTNYDKTEGGGFYTFNVYTGTIPGTIPGILLFDIQVQWDPVAPPFYSNSSKVTLNGLVDYVRSSLQSSGPTPPTVQITGDVFFLVTYRDLDHNSPISGAETLILVEYVPSGTIPASLSIVPTGTPGVYNVSFSTSDLSSTGVYTVEITIPSSKYSFVSATPQFTVTLINSGLAPVQTSYTVNWKETAIIFVDFMDMFHGYNITGASLKWYLGGTFGGFMTETATIGRYRVDIDTSGSLFSADTFVLTIVATINQYKDAQTQVALYIQSLPSDIVFITPPTGVFEVHRGNPVDVKVKLNDTLYGGFVGSFEDTAYIAFQGYPHVPLTWNGTDSTFVGVLPGYMTILDPGSYDVRITVIVENYQPASEQFKILVEQTETTLKVIGDNEVDTVYSKVVNFTLKLTEDIYNATIDDATIYWYQQSFNKLNLTFSFDNTTGYWKLSFNTSQGFYGTWGLTFRAFPTNQTLASSTTTLTLTIKKIATEVIAPTIAPQVYWGWAGNISFTYNDTSFEKGVVGAEVFYRYGPFDKLTAYDLGNGTYLVFINTTWLTSNSQHRIIVEFGKDNYEERTGGINIFVNLRPTELTVIVDDERTYATSGDTSVLEVPMGDSIDITFLFNDTSLVGGLNGGLDGAGFEGSLNAPAYFGGSSVFLTGLDGGFYSFTFNTNNLSLYEYNEFVKIILENQFFLTITFSYPNRIPQSVTVQIRIIEIPVQVVYDGPTTFNLIHGDPLELEFTLRDTWHNSGVDDANITWIQGASATVSDYEYLDNGLYRVTVQVVGQTGDSLITLTMTTQYHESINFVFTVSASPNDTDILIGQITRIGLPISLLVITLLGLYVRVWSVPKRIRQINGQIKALRKGKIPKPISDVKGRSEIIAELFNDTYAKTRITRLASQMPEESVPIDVPEMGELLVQLAILTNLNADELEDFKADISKMKFSEQAAFVREVIVQEAIRAARREGKTVEEIIAVVEKAARERLSGEVEEEVAPVAEESPEVETVFLDHEPTEPEPTEFIEPEPSEQPSDEAPDVKSEKMSHHEIEELRKELEKKGVPPYEIDTIIEQARELPRELIEELVRSLDKDLK